MCRRRFSNNTIDMDQSRMEVMDFSTGNPSGAVIFLHGFGDSGLKAKVCMRELMPLESLTGLSHIKMFFPSAPEMYVKLRDKVRNITSMVATSWFDGERLGDKVHEIDCNYEDCDRAAASIVNIIEQIEASGIPRSRIVLAGFSQGGMLAQYVAFTKVRGIAGVIVMASVYPFAKAKILEPPHPVLHQLYGVKDPIIPKEVVRHVAVLLGSLGVDVRLRLLPSSAHEMDEHFVKVFFQVLNNLLLA